MSNTADISTYNMDTSQLQDQLEQARQRMLALQQQTEEIRIAMERFAQTQGKTADKTQQMNKELDSKAGKNFKAGMDVASTSLKAFDKLVPGVLGTVANVVDQISAAQATIRGLSSGLMQWGTGIGAALGIVATIAGAVINNIREAEEKRRQAFEEGVESYQKHGDAIRELETNLNVLNNEKSTLDELQSARSELASSFPELILAYDEEGQAILANNEILEAYLQKQKEARELARDKITAYADENLLEDYQTAVSKLNHQQRRLKLFEENDATESGHFYSYDVRQKENEIVDAMIMNNEIGLMEDIGESIDAINKKIIEEKEWIAELEQSIRTTTQAQMQSAVEATDAVTGLKVGWEDLNTVQQAVANEIYNNSFSKILTGAESVEEVIKNINQTLADPVAFSVIQAQIGLQDSKIGMYDEELAELDRLSTAYQTLAEGRYLEQSLLYELTSLYPEVAAYLAETGDITLNNGQILKDVINSTRQLHLEELQRSKEKIETKLLEAESYYLLTEAQMEYYEAAGLAIQANPEYRDLLKNYPKEEAAYNSLKSQMDDINAKIAIAKSKAAEVNRESFSSPKSTSSAVKSTRNEALANELKLLDQKKKMDQLTSVEELKQLERIQKSYRMNADEKADLEYRIYALKKQMAEEEEKANTERLNAEYKAIENKKSLGEMSAKEELRRLEEIQRTFVKNKEEEIDLEIKIYNLKKELRDEDIESLNTLGDAVTEALRGQYEKQKEAEEQRIQDSIDSWKQWEEDTVSAIQGQLNALDELEKQQEEADRQAEYQRKKEAAELALAYEKDAYNRQQMQKELNRIEEEERKRREAVERENERERLQQEMEAVKNDSQKHQDALQEELDGLSKTYDELMSDFNLRAEAEKLILKSSQDQLIELIQSYAPQYDLLGQSFGEKLVDGFKSKVGDIEAYFQSIQQRISAYQDNLAYTANAAADRFWQDRAQYEQKLSGQSAPAAAKRDVTMIVNFNQPVESPIEIRRQLNRAAEDFARRIGG